MIRAATAADIPAMLEIGKRLHAKSGLARYALDEQGSRILVAQCIAAKTLCAFIAERDEKIVGMLLGQEDKYPYLKARFATDILFCAERPGAGRDLMRRFIRWAFEERKVDQMLLGVSFGGKSEKASAFYKRFGFRPTGGLFVMDREKT